MRRGSAARFHAQRLAWLRAHPTAWADVPTLADDVADANRLALDTLESLMVAQGLLGSGSRDVRRDTIRRLVGEVRTGVNPWRERGW